ncbi:MAG: hypothetical protein A4E57_03162 [Syntrophorhabdaceae bacterium PtaU1.Bin034]|nr:MAG: hypothetical protein A4E57_03162 [Syntrophorhabdaceae bacterium PtaU1.Bin034]
MMARLTSSSTLTLFSMSPLIAPQMIGTPLTATEERANIVPKRAGVKALLSQR